MSRVNKTAITSVDVYDFLATVDDEQKRLDSLELIEMMQEVSGHPPKMWESIIGFDQYHYVYNSGHQGDICVIGFSPRKNALVLYLLNGYQEEGLKLARLGKHSIGKACLYIKQLSDVDLTVLREMVETPYAKPSSCGLVNSLTIKTTPLLNGVVSRV